MAASITNPYGKCSLKVKSLKDMTAGERLSALTSNLIQVPVKDGRRDNTPGVTSAPPSRRSVTAEKDHAQCPRHCL